MTTNKDSKKLGYLYKLLWPIHKNEIKLVLPIGLMMFCVLFNLGVMKSLKDSLIVTSIGAEAISFIKLYVVLPIALIFTAIYFKLSNIMSLNNIFVLITSCFIGFFIIFAYVIFPYQDFYHFSPDFINDATLSLPHLKWPIKILSKWSYVITYVLAELWSSIVVNLLFWQLANQIINSEQATRLYLFLAMIGNLGLIMAGACLKSFSYAEFFPEIITSKFTLTSGHELELTLKLLTIVLVFSTMLTVCLLQYLVLFTKHRNNKLSLKEESTKTKLSFKESIRVILNSHYILNIALIVICYSLAINIIEGAWKAKLQSLFYTTEYLNFMGNFNIATGITCVIFTFIGTVILQKFGWRWAASISPMTLAISGSLFFVASIIARYYDNDETLIFCAIIIGSLQNIFSKAAKYSIFDATKEMAYIPLSIELKSKGKAAVEVVGSKLGKSCGSVLQSGIFILFPMVTFDSIIPFLFSIFIVIISVWIYALNALSKKYNELLLREKNNIV